MTEAKRKVGIGSIWNRSLTILDQQLNVVSHVSNIMERTVKEADDVNKHWALQSSQAREDELKDAKNLLEGDTINPVVATQ